LKLSHSIKIACKVPSSLNLLLIRGEEGIISSKKFRGTRSDSLTLRNTRKHSFQVWAFDKNKQPFYNFDSLYMQWRISEDSFGTLVYPKTSGFSNELK